MRKLKEIRKRVRGWLVAAAGSLLVTCASAALPAGYQPLNGIISNGSDTYFDTDFTPNPQTDKIEVTLTFVMKYRNQTVFSARSLDSMNSWTLFVNGDGTSMRHDYAASQTTLSGRSCAVGTRYTFTVENNVFT